MTQVTAHLRARVIAVAIEEAGQRLLDGLLTFSEILGPDGDVQAWQHLLNRLKGQRQGHRFLEVCYRHDNPTAWVAFLAYEMRKKDSPWQGSEVERFCQRLPVWWSAMEEGSAVNLELRSALQRFISSIGAWELKAEEYQRWRLTLLRRVFRQLLREEAS